jgi:hypothetical protein
MKSMTSVKLDASYMYSVYGLMREIASKDMRTKAMTQVMDKVEDKIGSMANINFNTIQGLYYDLSQR